MKRFLILIFLIITCATNLFAQDLDTIITKDYNKDGVADTLLAWFYYDKCVYIDFYEGMSEKWYSLGLGEYSSEFCAVLSFPQRLLSEDYKDFRDTVAKLYKVPDQIDSIIGPSLKWLIDASNNQFKISDSDYFIKVFDVNSNWTDSLPPFPNEEVHRFNADSVRELIREYDHERGFYPEGELTLIYRGYNHKKRNISTRTFDTTYTAGPSSDKLKTYYTAHGVLAEIGGKYSWFFVNNGNLTDGPDKLRWPSIENVLIYKDHIVLHHVSAPHGFNQVFLINTSSGRVGQLKLEYDYSCDYTVEVSVKGDQLSIFSTTETPDDSKCTSAGELILNLEELIESLNNISTLKTSNNPENGR